MKELASTEFRKRFARLAEPTVVTVNGHPIGTWLPVSPDVAAQVKTLRGLAAEYDQLPNQPVVTSQAQRDDLLRKINRSR